MRRKWSMVLLFVSLVVMMSPILSYAQDGERSEQAQALMERAFAAIDRQQTYESYVQTGYELMLMEVNVSMLGITALLHNSTEREFVTTYTQSPGGDNLYGDMTYRFDNRSDLPGDEVHEVYTVEAEVRFVDGQLYINAAYSEAEGDVPSLPMDWTAVSSRFDFPLYTELGLDAYRARETSILTTGSIEDMDVLTDAISDVVLRQDTLADNTPVDIISMAIGPTAFGDMLYAIGSVGDDPLFEDIVEMLDKDDYIILEVAVDANENSRWVRLVLSLSLDSEELGTLLEAQDVPTAGADMTLTVRVEFWRTYDQINADLEPIEAPLD